MYDTQRIMVNERDMENAVSCFILEKTSERTFCKNTLDLLVQRFCRMISCKNPLGEPFARTGSKNTS